MTKWVFTAENCPGREALSDAMMSYVANFARTGDPNDLASGLLEWKPWVNGQGEPKSILFDADLNAAQIEMFTEELTVPGVLEAMKSNVPESLYSQAIEFLSSYRSTAELVEPNE